MLLCGKSQVSRSPAAINLKLPYTGQVSNGQQVLMTHGGGSAIQTSTHHAHEVLKQRQAEVGAQVDAMRNQSPAEQVCSSACVNAECTKQSHVHAKHVQAKFFAAEAKGCHNMLEGHVNVITAASRSAAHVLAV